MGALNVLDRQTFDPIYLMPGDSLVVTHTGPGWFGRKTKLVETTITADQAMVFDEAVLIETVFENRRALGGLILEKV